MIGIDPKTRFYKPYFENDGKALAAKLARSLSFPGEFYCVVFIGAMKPFKKALEVVPYSLIYERENRRNEDKPK